MTLAAFPAELPRPFRRGYARADGEGRARSRADAGPPAMRRRFSSTADPVTLSFDFTVDELARFDRFFVEEIARGALPFLMTDWTTDGHRLATTGGEVLTDETGAPLVIASTWLCQIGEQLPQRTIAGVRRHVQFTVEVLP